MFFVKYMSFEHFVETFLKGKKKLPNIRKSCLTKISRGLKQICHEVNEIIIILS